MNQRAGRMLSLTPELVRELAGWHAAPCVSIYLPLDPRHPNIDAHRLTLKDMVSDARHELETTTLRRQAIDELLAPAEALLATERWSLGCRGYGLFGAPEHSIQVHLEFEVPLLCVVADHFVVTPLVAALATSDPFYVLALSQHSVRLFRGRRNRLIHVTVPDLPASRADALWYEHHERRLNVHGGSHQGVDRITGTLHGSPSDRDLRKEQLQRFFRIVDEALWGVLHDQTAPLFVAGVDYELAVYREANHYPHLAGMVDVGNPERLSPDELHSLVWPAAADVLDAPRRQLVERITSAQDPLTSIPAILSACREGRVAALVAQPTRLLWGRLDAANGHPNRNSGDIELISAAIGAAFDQGAVIYPAAPGELPGDAPVAVLLRY
jgi:Bacterial archaeo-eukaryotic release factor family 3